MVKRQPTPPLPKFASVINASAYSGLSASTIRRLITTGQLPANRVGTRVLVEYDALDRVIRGGNEADTRTMRF